MYKSLAEWATRATAAQSKLAKAKPGTAAFDVSKLRFQALGRTPSSLAKLEVGTVLRYALHSRWHYVWLKTSPEEWLWNAGETPGLAMSELERELRRLKKSDYKADLAELTSSFRELDPKQRKTIARALALPM